MIGIRAAKVTLVAAVALFASLVTFGNHYSEQTDRPMSAFGPKQRLGDFPRAPEVDPISFQRELLHLGLTSGLAYHCSRFTSGLSPYDAIRLSP